MEQNAYKQLWTYYKFKYSFQRTSTSKLEF